MTELTRIVIDGSEYQIALPNKSTDYIQGMIFEKGVPYELDMLRDMASRLKEGDLVLDVGANIGNHTLYLSAVSGCHVWAFEPNENLCHALQTSIEANDLSQRVKLHCKGVGSQPGRAHFSHFYQSNLGAQSIEVDSDADNPIDVVSLDDLEWSTGGVIKAIKIDVEGMELDVLHGAEQLILSQRPYLYVECQSYDQYQSVQSYLKKLGYEYMETFNATPTHLFLHHSLINPSSRVEHLVDKVQRLEYVLKPELAKTRKELNHANMKYRGASGNVKKMKELLDEKEAECKQVECEKDEAEKRLKGVVGAIGGVSLDELFPLENSSAQDEFGIKYLCEVVENLKAEKDKEIREAKKELKELNESLAKTAEKSSKLQRERQVMQGKFEEVSKDNDRKDRDIMLVVKEKENVERALSELSEKYHNASMHQIPALESKLADQEEGIFKLKQRIENLDMELAQATQESLKAQQNLSNLKSSLTYKAGLHLRAATYSVPDALKLPVRLWRLRQQAQQVRKATVEIGSSSVISEGGEQQITGTVETETGLAVTASRDLTKLITQPLVDKQAKKIRVACVMDDFTFGSYQPECDLHQLTPQNWSSELVAFQPELLFIESAWRGKDELWGSKVGHCSQELQGIVEWCRERGIPTVFWNKEDPVHFETFLNTARLFDFVFTTDLDCIHRYKAALGHDQIYFLPFACQPEVHNPVEKYQRKDAFCFAGAYYARYPERTRDLESFVKELPEYRPLEIYDRNYGKSDPNYQFPETYQPYIVGTLPFEEIDKAYKGYRYAINLNSIKQSQTMFARRVYELLGSNTLTVSNFSRGVRLMFGDLVVTSDSGSEVKRRLERLQATGSIERLRLAGVRKAMQEHTYTERFAYVLSKVCGQEVSTPMPSFKVLASASTVEDIRYLASHVERQAVVKVSLTVVLQGELTLAQAQAAVAATSCDVELRSADTLSHFNLSDLAGDASWIAGMVPQDHYGRHYLLDIALATRYSDAGIIGKAAYHCWQDGRCELRDADEAYRPANHLLARRSSISVSSAERISVQEWLESIETWSFESPGQLAIDAYNYCENGAEGDLDVVKQLVDDLPVEQGASLKKLVELAESVAPMESSSDDVLYLDGRELVSLLRGKPFNLHSGHEPRVEVELGDGAVKLSRNKALEFSLEGSVLEIGSELPDGKHEYVYAAKDIDCKELAGRLRDVPPATIPLHMEVEPGLNLSLVVLFLDAGKQRISHAILQPNRNHTVRLPEGTAFVRFGLRIYAGGRSRIERVLFGHIDLEPVNILGQSDVLLLTNHYPSYDDLYRNGFVHSRVQAYREQDVHVDVFRLRKGQPISWHEFQNVDVTTGSQEALRCMLASGAYRHILVHFLDQSMWEVLREFIDDICVTVWVHGAEVQPWWRRVYNYQSESDLAIAKKDSEVRVGFWKTVLSNMHSNLKLVFVSKYFAEEVMEDVGVRLPDSSYKIIHNPVDTELFSYQEKAVTQRKKVLSIRPYASRKYANDLSVDAVLILSREDFFNEMEFKFIGDGALFDDVLHPIKEFDNVSIERRFLSQIEIASIHKEYGVFLCPTRMDAQGVSKDEAMSSGLIPVTNAVTAIPEFVDDSCGVLAGAESAEEMARGIKEMVVDESIFKEKSKNAAMRARAQVSKKNVIVDEISIFSDKR